MGGRARNWTDRGRRRRQRRSRTRSTPAWRSTSADWLASAHTRWWRCRWIRCWRRRARSRTRPTARSARDPSESCWAWSRSWWRCRTSGSSRPRRRNAVSAAATGTAPLTTSHLQCAPNLAVVQMPLSISDRPLTWLFKIESISRSAITERNCSTILASCTNNKSISSLGGIGPSNLTHFSSGNFCQ